MQNLDRYRKITIYLNKGNEIHAYLSLNDTNSLLDQIYSVFSGEFDDNCIEIISSTEFCKETILLRASEILYIKTQSDVSNE